MNNTIDTVVSHIVFHFSNGETYELPYINNYGTTDGLMNYATSMKPTEKLYSSSSDNIVGNICANSFALELNSVDKLLVPSNEDSEYYGYMNDTAYIDITCDVIAESETIPFGRYYVDTWESGATSSTSNEVSISCVDLLSKIKNITLKKLRLKRNISFNDYLKVVMDSLNAELPEHMQILYTDADLNIYRNSEYAWQMYFNNIDRDDIEAMFNCIAQYTISYIWIDRNRHIKTDHLLDDTSVESVCDISGAVNLFEYGNVTGGIDKMSGVSVQYVNSIAYEDKQLLKLNDYQLYKGTNNLLDQTLSSENVLAIHTIEIECKQGSAVCYSFSNYKKNIDMYIEATESTTATITIYGTIINESYDTITKYKDTNNKSTLAEVKNRVLKKELIQTYTDGLIDLMNMKNSQIYAEGYINPKVKLGDLVHVQGTRLGINGYYKVTGLEFTLGINYRCKATLLKTPVVEQNINDILYNDNILLFTRLSGETINTKDFSVLTASQNTIIERKLATELNNFRTILYGGE